MLDDRRQDGGWAAFPVGPEWMGAFHDRPAVIAALLNQVDHLPQVLAHFAAPEVAGFLVEAVAPRLAQAVGPDLGPRAIHPDERIILGNAVVLAGLRVVDGNTEQGAEHVA